MCNVYTVSITLHRLFSCTIFPYFPSRKIMYDHTYPTIWYMENKMCYLYFILYKSINIRPAGPVRYDWSQYRSFIWYSEHSRKRSTESFFFSHNVHIFILFILFFSRVVLLYKSNILWCTETQNAFRMWNRLSFWRVQQLFWYCVLYNSSRTNVK